ncbi:transcriptional regulator GcvA [Paralimibaculum aggregatum]|uniref:Transcriptional regulator GcvA n=1 Tax=Paralimibaculum aggregatum TaxID=3036245 RepID=A0ABQ6LN83_9RHOB|nr:LysR substrate-binding domain-containing protein [Limibaculum sp. NKW23]GMG83784.1 transcriptional regulator GcvA [Limibaculum sp. NKW23]
MRRRLPPLPAIRAFEAAARLLSFREAAAELCVTPSAVSHQVRALEDHLGRSLFRRAGNRIALTETGRAYRTELSRILDALDAVTRQVADTPDASPITVHCTPGFASRWLVPRLGRAPYGDRIEITVSQGAPSTDFATNGAEIVIQWTVGPVPGAISEPLMESARYPVAAPELLEREGIARPADLLRQTLLHDEVLDAWAKWFRLAGVAGGDAERGPRLPHCEMALTAAEQGQGVALAYDAMARTGLASGRLVRPFEIEVPPITIYSVAYAERHRRCPQVRAFRDWIFEEVRAEGTLDRQSRLEPAG